MNRYSSLSGAERRIAARKERAKSMDKKHFDEVTRLLGAGATRRTGIRALVGGLVGIGVAAGATGVDAQKKRDKCTGNRRCGGECCRPGFACVLGRCQQTQNSCTPQGNSCDSSDFADCCCGGYKCIDNTCRKAQIGEPCDKRQCNWNYIYTSDLCAEGTCTPESGNNYICR